MLNSVPRTVVRRNTTGGASLSPQDQKFKKGRRYSDHGSI